MAQARAENELLKKALALIEAKKAELKAIESELKARVSAIEITRLKEEKLLSDMAASRKKFGDFFLDRQAKTVALIKDIKAANMEKQKLLISSAVIEKQYKELKNLKDQEDKAQAEFHSNTQQYFAADEALREEINTRLNIYLPIQNEYKKYREIQGTAYKLIVDTYEMTRNPKQTADAQLITCESEYKIFSDQVKRLRESKELDDSTASLVTRQSVSVSVAPTPPVGGSRASTTIVDSRVSSQGGGSNRPSVSTSTSVGYGALPSSPHTHFGQGDQQRRVEQRLRQVQQQQQQEDAPKCCLIL